MNQDKAGEKYWKSVWSEQDRINKIDINYYTNNLLYELYSKYFVYDKSKSICEIGCAMSSNLLFFHDTFGYQINGFDYEEKSALKTKEIYQNMGYSCSIKHKDFFEINEHEKYDILTSFGVFEHFENLDFAIKHTLEYLKEKGYILTVIPNMNGIVGFLQKKFNKKVYDIHIPYTKNDILHAHESSGYKTFFCDYYGIYQGGVINIDGVRNENLLRKVFAVPGKPLYYLSRFFDINLNSKYNSPYIIYIGQKI